MNVCVYVCYFLFLEYSNCLNRESMTTYDFVRNYLRSIRMTQGVNLVNVIFGPEMVFFLVFNQIRSDVNDIGLNKI